MLSRQVPHRELLNFLSLLALPLPRGGPFFSRDTPDPLFGTRRVGRNARVGVRVLHRTTFRRCPRIAGRRDPWTAEPARTIGLSEVLAPNHIVSASPVYRTRIPPLEVPPVGQQQLSLQRVGRGQVRALRRGVRRQRYPRRVVLQQIHRQVQLHRRRTPRTKPSDDIGHPSNLPMTSRRPSPSNVKSAELHCV